MRVLWIYLGIEMIPLDKMLQELFEVNPNFVIIFDEKSKETRLVEGQFIVGSGTNIDTAIYCSWLKIFGPVIERKELASITN